MKKALKTLLIIFIIITPIFVIDLIVAGKIKESNYYKKAEKDVITYLELRYGDGDFEINNTKYIGGCDILGNCRPDGYEVNLNTKYFDKNFNVVILKVTSQIYNDNFIDVLAKEKWNIEKNIQDYIGEIALEQLNEKIPERYNSKVSFNNKKVDDNFDFILYGKLPTIDDLIKSVKFYDPKFEINADLNSETKLLEFLKDLTKFYIEEFSSNEIFYNQESEYFRYKFDYSKLGVKDYKDQHNGYVFSDNDRNIRINIMGKVTKYTKEEILN